MANVYIWHATICLYKVEECSLFSQKGLSKGSEILQEALTHKNIRVEVTQIVDPSPSPEKNCQTWEEIWSHRHVRRKFSAGVVGVQSVFSCI